MQFVKGRTRHVNSSAHLFQVREKKRKPLLLLLLFHLAETNKHVVPVFILEIGFAQPSVGAAFLV